MKIAAPLHEQSIAPRFDTAAIFALTEVENGKVVRESYLDGGHSIAHERVAKLVENDVDILICNGISKFSAFQLRYYGIQVYPLITGELDEVLKLFLHNHYNGG